ncbi:MAG TPA: TraR/DksA C4-type zinc finger protein [Actinomycetota bacterium]|nr:TraR/DksA C4-type zinc finger protein [Actinomycetota bacterium]
MPEETQLEQEASARPDDAASPEGQIDGVNPGLFDSQTLTEIKRALLGQKTELEDQLESESQAISVSESEVAADIRSDDNPAEAGTATFEREKHLSIANNVQDLLEKSSKALDKIAQGSYGICEGCGKPISPERLKALPHALLCIQCKKAEERR